MKITKRQLRRIIKEEKAKVLSEQKVRRAVRRKLMEQPDIPDVMGAMGAGKFQPREETQDVRKLTAELLRDMNRGQVTAELGAVPDELYIMTGRAEGVTIKVLRSRH